MAEEDRTVCVYGLPTDVTHERLKDKLLVHFLRKKNGGGEVTSVSLTGQTPSRALVTFEERRVAQSVLHTYPHVLELDDKKYELSLCLPNQEPLSLNKVVLNMTATINCSQFPEAAESLNVLRSKFPRLRIELGFLEQTCTFQGSYTDCQGALAYMQILLQQLSKTKFIDCSGPKMSEPSDVNERAQFAPQSPDDHGFGFGQDYLKPQCNDAVFARSTLTEGTKIEEGALCEMDDDCADLSIIMEADVFAYLQGIKEYKQILQNHGVQVIHVTSEGVTTLYLESEVLGGSEVKKNIKQAHKELRQLCQQHEACLRKDEVKKTAIYMPNGLNEALKKVQIMLPNVLLSHDHRCVYLVGEKSEVSQAKQILFHGVEKDLISLTEMATSVASFSPPSNEPLERFQEGVNAPQSSVTPKLISLNKEQNTESGKTEYKLAARFKSFEQGLPGGEGGGDLKNLNAKMETLTLAPNSQSTPRTRSFPSPKDSTSNELTSEGTKAFRVTEPCSTGQDILFKNQPLLSDKSSVRISFSSTKAKSSTSAELGSTWDSGVQAYESSNTKSISGGSTKGKTDSHSCTTVPLLRRSNSFSGHLHQKEQFQNNQIKAETVIKQQTYPRGRSNSISTEKSREDCPSPTMEAEFTVPGLIWNYIKTVYRSQLDAMKSDFLMMSEKQARKGEITVMLKDTDSLKVEDGHRHLQNLVTVVASDFYFEEICLEELGVMEKDQVFVACCSSVRTQISQVVLHTTKIKLVLIGPKMICTQVGNIFKNVFPGKRSQSSFLQELISLQEAIPEGASKTSLGLTSKVDQPKVDQSTPWLFQEASHEVQSEGQSKQKSNKLDNPRPKKDDLGETIFANTKEETAQTMSDHATSLPLESHNKPTTLKQTNMPSHTPSARCVCGATGAKVDRTTCGIMLCSNCITMHLYCRVCRNKEAYFPKYLEEERKNDSKENLAQEFDSDQEEKEDEGIQGTMTCVEMPLSLAGFIKYTTVKITYCIPDGIQGDTDPNPGSPFEGGQFEAFLPLSPMGRSLLPSLKKAFDQGLTFVISSKKASGAGAKVNWGKIPHKTKMEGGKSSNGYPDSTYLTRLTDALEAHGIK
ncbi:hypothetical protein DNTS_017813 [Danionella cerebrum]|uniref:RING-type E3 ubiquitin transferase n=1 Tax=Danionella cerebrum TaxID=2873325 RepID=A0A553R089_9TELE|nr:hypothetical protein DNTS_017813 [Danionella translucida]